MPLKLVVRIKGGAGSGNWGHTGRPGAVGGSGGAGGVGIGSFSHAAVTEAFDKLDNLITSGGDVGDVTISDGAREFLQQTVTDKSGKKLYRGLGLVKSRVDADKREEVNSLRVGDAVPDFLSLKQGNEYASYTKKVSIAKDYSEGNLSMVIEAHDVPRSSILVDTRNLYKLVQGTPYENLVDSNRRDYFKGEAEVIVIGAIPGVVRSTSGSLPLGKSGSYAGFAKTPWD